jgi:hypothetical protein
MTEARRDDLNELLAVLTREIGLEPLSFAEDGYCALGVESGRIIHLQQEGDDLVLMAELGDLPRGPDRLAKAELLLRANAFGMGTNGAQGLAGSLGDFVEAAERWARAMTADTEAPVAESSNVASAPDPGSFV